MTEQNHESKDSSYAGREASREKHTRYDVELDAADKSLSEALRISFIILKIIMIVLVGFFLVSGFESVGSDEQALVLRFGKIRGVGEDRLLGPGLHWIFPYPVEEIVKIPTAKKVNLAINSFWYYQRPSELLPKGPKDRIRVPEKLDPIKDGYCITRSEKQTIAGFTGSDYNIVHCKWQLTYQINDPERFFKNVYVDISNLEAGQNYADVIPKGVTGLLKYLVEDSVVTAMVNYAIDEAISSSSKIPEHVRKLLQKKLDRIESGIKVVSVQLIDVTWPRQVDYAFLASIQASQASQKVISEAKLYAEKTLNETAGPVAAKLLAAIEDKTVGKKEKESLWFQLAGTAQERIDEARAYRIKVVEAAKANADYLQEILPEYRKHPRLVVQKIYQDAIEYVLNNADEKIIIQPTEGTGGREIRIQLGRDPAISREKK